MNRCTQHHRSATVGLGRRCSVGLALHRRCAAPSQLMRRRVPAWDAQHGAAGAHCVALLPPARASSDGASEGSWDDASRRGHWSHGHPDDSWDFVEDDGHVPPPSNTPVHEDDVRVVRSSNGPHQGGPDDAHSVYPPAGLGTFDGLSGFDGPLHHHFWAHQMHGSGSGLSRSARWQVTNRPGLDMRLLGADVLQHMGPVYVILFGVGGAHETEGIYSLRAFGEDGLPQETIIVFEDEEDAHRYAGLLEAAMDHVPSVCSIPPTELLEFCADAGYQCRLEPQGSLLIPPDFNVGVTDWERASRLRQGMFAVLDAEPPRHGNQPPHQLRGWGPNTSSSSSSSSSGHPPPQHSGPLSSVSPARPGGPSSSSMAKYHPGFSDDELADIRSMLESLLPLTGTPAGSPAAASSGSGSDAVGAEPMPPAPGGGDDRGSKA